MKNHYTIIPKSEWTRIKNQVEPFANNNETVNFKLRAEILDEKSNDMKKKWGDNQQRRLEEALGLKQLREKDRNEAALKLANKIAKEQAEAGNEAVKTAKYLIFLKSGYGQELTSALLDSIMFEEQQLQREFNETLKERAKLYNTKLEAHEKSIIDEDKTDLNIKRRSQNLQVAEFNRKMHNDKLERGMSDKKIEREIAREEADMTRKLLEYEALEMVKCEPLERQAIEQYEADQKEYLKGKAERNAIDDKITQVWKRHLDKRRCMEKEVYAKTHLERHETEGAKKAYEAWKQALERETKKYNEFLQKGIDRAERRVNIDSIKSRTEQQRGKRERIEIAHFNKQIGEESKITKYLSYDPNKCECWRQSLFTSACTDNKKNKIVHSVKDFRPPCYLAPTTLTEQLCCREKLPSPWTGTATAHEYYAEQAVAVLHECRYKHPALKAIANYQKNNGTSMLL